MEKKWRCTVCGYVHTGETAPEKCPLCKVPAEKFVELVEENTALTWADEHTVGVAKGCDQGRTSSTLRRRMYRSWYVYRNEQTS